MLTVVSTWIADGCVQFWGRKKCFHTAWVKTGKAQSEHMFSAVPPTADIGERDWHVSVVP
jgi:hypothetical protein